MPSSHLILCHLLLLPPSVFPVIRVFSNESVLHIRWPKYWSFSFSIRPSDWIFMTDFILGWTGCISLQSKGLSSLLKHHSSKASILQGSAFLIVQLSHTYMTTWITLATWCKELTHLKRPWCWERLKVGGEGEDKGWDDWMASPTQWTWVWVNSGSWWWTKRSCVLQSMELQRVRHNWATELNWNNPSFDFTDLCQQSE